MKSLLRRDDDGLRAENSYDYCLPMLLRRSFDTGACDPPGSPGCRPTSC